MKRAFERKGHSVERPGCVAERYDALNCSILPLIFLDQCLPDGDGIDALPAILKAAPRCKVIMMTAFGDSNLIVRAIRQGAYNYLDKPFPLDAAMNMAEHAFDSIRFRNRIAPAYCDSNLLGSSPTMMKITEALLKVAPYQDTTVLRTGERGTGKEGVAKEKLQSYQKTAEIKPKSVLLTVHWVLVIHKQELIVRQLILVQRFVEEVLCDVLVIWNKINCWPTVNKCTIKKS